MKPCTQCGRCCTYDGFMRTMQATREDVARWKQERRHDILKYCDELGEGGETMGLGFADLWIHPISGDELGRCPFVRKIRGQEKYTCTIYGTRPAVCRDYPTHVSHMMTVNCEMLEDGDTDEDVERFKLTSS